MSRTMDKRKPRMSHRKSEQELLENYCGRGTEQRRGSIAESATSSTSIRTSNSTEPTQLKSIHTSNSSRTLSSPRRGSSSQPVPQALSNGHVHFPPPTSPPPPPVPARQSTPVPQVPEKSTPRRASEERSKGPRRRQKKGEQCLIRRRVLIIFSLSSIILSLISVGVLATVFHQPFAAKWQNRTFKEGSYETCVKCVYLKQEMEDVLEVAENKRELRNEIQNGEVYCCARTSRQLSALLKLVLKQHRRPIVYKDSHEVEMRNTPVAHRSLKPSDILTDLETIMKIDTTRNEKQAARKVGLKNNSLKIEVSGWYYVYSSTYLSFANQKSLCSSLKHQQWQHSIQRKGVFPSANEFQGVLTKAIHTCCFNCTNEKESVFTGGVFKLFQGDDVYVTVSNGNAIVLDDESTFLGLMMLGSE